MCTPGIGIAFTVAQAGLQMASSMAQANAMKAQGKAQNNYYNYLANVNEQNALLAERTGRAQSKAVQDVQKVQGKQLKTSQAEFRANQHATMVASGITLSSVTAGDIDKNTMNKQAIDENMLRYNADIKSYEAKTGAQNQAFGLRTQATGYRYAGRNAVTAANVGARNTLLGGAFSSISTLSGLAFSPFASANKGINLGQGTTQYGIKVPSRYIPPR